ncbi:MAG: hypothetical protein JNM18_20575 [Planctomycetaceae bacterium]|nr:hypothetical protein [Planctomycetaceae bacterium]
MFQISSQRLIRVFVLTLLALVSVASAKADERRARLWYGFTCSNVANCAKDCCPDNYCPKPLPCVRVPLCYQCDDYCPKPLPCVQKPNCFECDRYCRKPIPLLCCPNCTPGICGPGNWCKP